jgi:hypothetical protein
MAKFEELFKPGDIICSDHFYAGKCLLVDVVFIGIDGKYGKCTHTCRYTCYDLVIPDQKWSAYEFVFDRPNNWRIATDDDIVNYLARFVQIKVGKVGLYEVLLNDEDIILRDTVATEGYGDVYLNAKELMQLKQIIEERVEV